jgi:hypothetical protein
MKPDVIERAYELIKVHAMVKATGRDYWQRIDANLNVAYETRRESCSCYFWIKNNQGREIQKHCKHQLSAYCAPVVLFIIEMRKALTVDDLMAAVRGHQETVCNELPEFVAMANFEYQTALGRIGNQESSSSESAEAEQAPKAKRERRYKSRSVNRNGESIKIIEQRSAPEYYGGIQIR